MSARPSTRHPPQVSVERAGVQTTIQDCGRFGYQHLGVVPAGAMDMESMLLANALVGNAPDTATLEMALQGPTLRFACEALIAVAGASYSIRAARGQTVNMMASNRPILLAAGTQVAFDHAPDGARAYLAVAGGFDVPSILGSRCTYVPAGFGGHAGRALKKGDQLALLPQASSLARTRFDSLRKRNSGVVDYASAVTTVRWSVRPSSLSEDEVTLVRFINGRHRALFTAQALQAFESSTYRISPDSNRMGYRMIGPRLERASTRDVLSEPTNLGTVQVPADGSPIVLMADHQTTGGYAKIAEVASADIPRLAQLRPGQQVRFVPCSLAQALALARAARIALATKTQALAWLYEA